MSINKINNYIKNNSNTLSFLFISLFALILGGLIIYINSTSNILGHSYRDIYLYLIEALKFSGYNISGYNYVDYLSPLIPFLTSIFFRLGFLSESTIFIITGVFYILGIIGLYLLLKLRFNNIYSIFGSVLYASLTVNMMWAANGSLDVPCACLSIWTVYFFIKAIKENQKYFYLAIPLSILTVFAKYTGAIIIAVLILYFLSQKDIIGNIKKYGKNLFGGVILGLLCTVPFFYYYLSNNIPFGFLNQAQTISSTTTLSEFAIRKHKGNNLFYYFTNLPRFIYSPNNIIPIILLIITIIGLIFALYKVYKILKTSYTTGEGKLSFLFKKLKLNKPIIYILLVLSIIGMITSFLVAGKLSFVKCELIFYFSIFIFSLSFNTILENYNKLNKERYNTFTYDLMMIGWFMGHMIFLSAHLTKVDRYATAFAPPLMFFITYSLNSISKLDKIKDTLKDYLPLIFIVILIISAGLYLTANKHDDLVDNEKYTVNWMVAHNADIDNITIWSDRGPIYTWYLQKEVHYVTDISDMDSLSEQMLENNTKYFISLENNLKINGYEKFGYFGKVNVYKKVI